MTGVDFELKHDSDIDIVIYTKDVGPLLIDSNIQIFKPIYIEILVPILNSGIMKSLLNSTI